MLIRDHPERCAENGGFSAGPPGPGRPAEAAAWAPVRPGVGRTPGSPGTCAPAGAAPDTRALWRAGRRGPRARAGGGAWYAGPGALAGRSPGAAGSAPGTWIHARCRNERDQFRAKRQLESAPGARLGAVSARYSVPATARVAAFSEKWLLAPALEQGLAPARPSSRMSIGARISAPPARMQAHRPRRNDSPPRPRCPRRAPPPARRHSCRLGASRC
jgi:hypothetical protein